MTTSSPQGHGMMVSTTQPKKESQVGYLRVRFLSKTLQILQSLSYSYCSLFGFILMMGFHELTMAIFLAVIVDRRHIAPRLSFTNIVALNYLLRLEIFVSEDRQLWAVHLILDFEPISRIFQEIGHAIRARNPRINHIDVSKPYFLARDDFPSVRLPIQQIPHPLISPLQQVPLEAPVTTEEEIASSRLSLEEEIDQFRFEEDVGQIGRASCRERV